ncbi:hypothetical protein CPC08DRAFT_770213 [Agrocybe pediades]|nr:hypothetical protein CPC08DRAFT_770213 [Agrocybe pediades]
MEGIGQEAYTHACSLCYYVFKDDDGRLMKIHAAVCDGDTIGHPCCAIHDCKEPLTGHRDRYCAKHATYNEKCAVVECPASRGGGFRTCELAEHQALESAYFSRGKAILQLRRKLKKAEKLTATPSDAVQVPQAASEEDTSRSASDDEFDEVILKELCDGKSAQGNVKAKAYFGRRWTHNEQILMRPCGIIILRATFYGSEAISSVNATFPTPLSTPQAINYDNNCSLRKHLDATHDNHFKDTAMLVDVFHFNSKHKGSDVYCQKHCNPASFPELMNGNQWRFNTSCCEQTNVWLGGYQAILRDMEGT